MFNRACSKFIAMVFVLINQKEKSVGVAHHSDNAKPAACGFAGVVPEVIAGG
jgi:hypothetical protein